MDVKKTSGGGNHCTETSNTSDPAKVRSVYFYDKCMRNAKSVIEANELEDEDPFEL